MPGRIIITIRFGVISGDYIWWIYGSGAYPNLPLSPLQFTAGTNSKDFANISCSLITIIKYFID